MVCLYCSKMWEKANQVVEKNIKCLEKQKKDESKKIDFFETNTLHSQKNA